MIQRELKLTQHAKVASLQAISSMFVNQLNALERAKNMGVNENDLCPFILCTLMFLYASSDTAMKKIGTCHLQQRRSRSYICQSLEFT